MNLKAIYAVDDIEHHFIAYIVLHIRYDSTPLPGKMEDFEPQVSFLGIQMIVSTRANV